MRFLFMFCSRVRHHRHPFTDVPLQPGSPLDSVCRAPQPLMGSTSKSTPHRHRTHRHATTTAHTSPPQHHPPNTTPTTTTTPQRNGNAPHEGPKCRGLVFVQSAPCTQKFALPSHHAARMVQVFPAQAPTWDEVGLFLLDVMVLCVCGVSGVRCVCTVCGVWSAVVCGEQCSLRER